MARTSTRNSLAIDRFAKILGLNPAHFNQASASGLAPAVFPTNSNCNDIWFQYQWQADLQVSREDIDLAIQQAEQDIETELGYFVAPRWTSQEVQQYPRYYRPEAYGNGLNVRGQPKSVIANKKKFTAGGRRATTLVETATTGGGTLVYSDDDGDGFFETATITVPTTLTNPCEIKLYFAGKSAAEIWEVRPVKSTTVSGGNVVIVCDSWLLINPDLWEQFPNSDGQPAVIDISTTSNFVTSVDVYREYNDFTQASAQLVWGRDGFLTSVSSSFVCPSCNNSNGCNVCNLILQDGCIRARDINLGEVVPTAATFNATTEQWSTSVWSECREPDMVKLWYLSGNYSNEFLSGSTCDALSDELAQAITWLAVTKIQKELCTCNQIKLNVEWLQEDLAETSGGVSHFLTVELANNPFGTRRGAAMAWQRIQQIKGRRDGHAVMVMN